MAKNANYVDGFVVPVPKKNLKKYLKLARMARRLWMKHGALSYTEAVQDDVDAGRKTSFPKSVKLKKGEVVVFAWVTFKNRKHRDKVNKSVMTDPEMQAFTPKSFPFDTGRMFWGGFKTIVK